MKKITLLFFMSLLSWCGYSQLALETFESNGNLLPTGWSKINVSGPGQEWNVVNHNSIQSPAYGGAGKVAFINRENVATGTAEDWLVTKQFLVPTNGQLRFQSRLTIAGNDGNTYRLMIHTGNTPGDPAAYTPIVPTMGELEINPDPFQTDYLEKVFNLPATSYGQQAYIAFVMNGDFGDRWLVDNVMVAAQCLDAQTLGIVSVGLNQAVLTWANPGGATEWDIDIVGALQAPTQVGISYTGIPPYTATTDSAGNPLQPNTDYKYYVRADCGGGNTGNWVGPFYFSTVALGESCTAPIVITTPSYSTTDNTGNYGDTVDGAPGGAAGCGSANQYLNGNDVFYSYTAAATGVISINVTNNGAYSGVFVYNSCTNVGVSCAGGAVTGFTPAPLAIPTFAVTAGQTYIIVISTWATPQTTPYTLVIQPVNCAPPVGLPSVGGLTSAQLSWTNPSSATSWQVVVQDPGDGMPAGVGTTVSTNTNYVATAEFDGTALVASTPYEYYVRADCGNGTFSAWAGPYPFNTTLCEAADQCNYTFLMTDSWGDGWNGNTMTVSQNGIAIATIGSTFTTGVGPVSVTVPVCDDLPLTLFWNAGGNFPGEVGVSIQNNFGQTIYTKPAGTGAQNSSLFTGLIDCDTPACLPPNGLEVTNISTTSVTLNWAGPNTGNWDYYVVPAGSPAPTSSTTGVNTTSKPVDVTTGLVAATNYVYYVRIVCDSSTNSTWAGPFPFTTAVCPLAEQCVYSFVMTDSWGDGWNGNTMTITQNGATVATIGSTFTTGQGPVTVNVAMCNDQPFELFWNAGGNFPGEVGVSIVNGFSQTIFTKPSGTGAQNSLLYSGTIDCDNPLCLPPTGLTAYDFEVDSAMLEWDGPATGNWEVFVVPANDPAPTATSTGTITTTNPVEVPLPTPGINYDYYVRVICDATTNSTWAGPFEFHSLVCAEADQCDYVFEMTDSWGDGWNGNTMTIFQNGVPVATIGSTFTTGNSQIAEVPLCPGVGFELQWNTGGNFANEVGVIVYTPFEEDLYTKLPGQGTQGTILYENDEADCTPPPCPKPQDLFVDALTLTTADLHWTEMGTATTWEVYVVPINSPAPLPADSGTSTTTMPHIATETVTGVDLTSGTTYEFYVRAICGGTDGNSNWSGPIVFTTLIENDDCDGAIDVDTNPGVDCDVFATGTVTGATGSSQAQSCYIWGDIEFDVWYSFEATATTHAVNINNMIGATFQSVIYEGADCGTLNQIACGNNSQTITGLTVGETYYVRVYTTWLPDPTDVTSFEVCINTPPPPILVTQDEYTVEELVTEVLIGSDCAQISNILSSTGTDFGMTNGIGYFAQNGSEFPMEAGIVLVSGDAALAPGPNQFPAGQSNNWPGWPGDTDLETIVNLPPGNTNDASWISFDFVSMTDELNFNFLFASEEYNAGGFECNFSDSFAFILTDNEDPLAAPINLAVLPNTNIPILVTNIHPDNGICPAINEQYFGQYNNTSFDPINFNGQTVVLTATGPVEVNHSYNIKLVIANASDNAYNSAVFLQAGSFNIGEPDLGAPSLVSGGNALCAGGSRLLDTGLSEDDFEFVWYDDNGVIPNETGSTYLVTESGEYTVEATFIGTDCATAGSVIVEFFDPVEDLTNAPDMLAVCDPDGFATFDLTENTETILEGVTGTYNLYYYLTEELAEEGDHTLALTNPEAFENTVQFGQTVWVRIEFILPTEICSGVKSFTLTVEDNTPEFTITPDFSICQGTDGTITVTPTNYTDTDATYTWTHDGAPYAGTTSTITVTEAGDYEVTIEYLGCEATATVAVEVTPVPVADDPADVTICDSYVLPVLTTGNYFTATGGAGTQLNAGETITSTQDVYVYAESGTTPNCTDENVFTVTIVPNPQVTTPGDLSACVSYTLPALSVGNYFTATGGTGTQLNAGELITTTQTIFVYAESGTTPNCIAEESFTVTITDSVEADAPADVTSCDSYVLPALSADNNYYTEANGAGTMLNAGDVITSTQEIHIYVATPTTPSCTDDNVFTVTIVPSPVPATPGDQSSCDSYVLPALTAGNYYTGTGGTGTMLAAGESVTSTQTIFVLVESGTTPNCTGEASFTVTIIPSPVADAPVAVTSCDSYVLPALSAGNNYYTGANGTGTMLSAGETITSTQQIHVFATSGTTPNCTDDNVFTVTIVPSPVVVTPGSQTACDSYVLPALTVGNYFTGPAGTGTQLNAGEAVTASQTIFVYAQSGTTPNCTDEESFAVTIVPSPVADAPGDVSSCDSYVLPSLGVGNYYTGPGGTGTQLAVGSTVSTSQRVYVFAQSGSCTDENSFEISIIETPSIAITEGCDENNVYVLEAIFTDEIYTPDNASFEWTDASGASLGTGSSIVINQGGIYYVTVTPNGGADCSVPGQINVVDTTCDVQRGISPNGDDKNESFDLTALDVRKLSIFNRYGAEVYSFNGAYTDQWEGQSAGGDELPTGTYFYMIERANGESRTGWVYINRAN